MTQAEALSILKSGANVFLTGEPGAGKSHTINQYVAYLRAHDIDPAVTASTGIAATHIGGVTIHSWSGIGVRKVLSEGDLDMLCQNERLVKRVGGARVLIIDEVSMLSMQTLMLADQACRALRRSSKPFGGLQVVLVGDFFQLPPVVSWEEQRAAASRVSQEEFVFEQGSSFASSQHAAPKPGSAPFAYYARAWNDLNPIPCYLHEQHRQEDARFLDVLSGVRSGEVTTEHRAQLQKRMNAPAPAGKTLQDITQLFSHNADVDRINNERLGAVPAAGRVFQMRTSGAPTMVESLKRTCLSPETLTLKMGAKVMFTKNNGEQGYVNGTTGEVVGWREDGAPLVRVRGDGGEVIAAEETDWEMEIDGRVVARVTQVPLRLAWAITVHKSQGMSLDEARIDLSRAFEYGQGYVALSRVRTLSGLFLLGLNERALQVHPDILMKDKEFREQSDRAEEAFGDMGADELKTLHTNFIRACGGKVEASAAGTSGRAMVRPARSGPKEPAWKKTLTLIKQGENIPNIAAQLDLTPGTILKHLEDLKEKGELHASDLVHLAEDHLEAVSEIQDFIREHGEGPFKPIFENFEGRHSYDLIRLAKLVGEE